MPNWAALKEQGRVKDIGIPWNDDELNAVYKLGIPAPFVRRGALSTEVYEEMRAADEAFFKKEGELPLEAMPRNDLMKKASSLGVEVTSAATEDAIRNLIMSVKKPEPVAKKSKKK